VAASSTGRLAALLVAADASPQWAESAPQCTTGDHGISATRSEVPLQRARPDTSLLLLDMVDLEVRPGKLRPWPGVLAALSMRRAGMR